MGSIFPSTLFWKMFLKVYVNSSQEPANRSNTDYSPGMRLWRTVLSFSSLQEMSGCWLFLWLQSDLWYCLGATAANGIRTSINTRQTAVLTNIWTLLFSNHTLDHYKPFVDFLSPPKIHYNKLCKFPPDFVSSQAFFIKCVIYFIVFQIY